MSSWLAQWPSLDRLQLLGDVEAWPLRFDDVDDAAQVTFGAPQAPDDLGMALMDRMAVHRQIPYPPGWDMLEQKFC
jgi:hypothetical protein